MKKKAILLSIFSWILCPTLVLAPLGLRAEGGGSSHPTNMGESKDEDDYMWPFTMKKSQDLNAAVATLEGCACDGVAGDAAKIKELFYEAEEKYREGSAKAGEAEAGLASVHAQSQEGNFSNPGVGETGAAHGAANESIEIFKESLKLLEEAMGIAEGVKGKIKEDCAEGSVGKFKGAADKIIGILEWIIERVEKSIEGGEATAEAIEAAAETQEEEFTEECEDGEEMNEEGECVLANCRGDIDEDGICDDVDDSIEQNGCPVTVTESEDGKDLIYQSDSHCEGNGQEEEECEEDADSDGICDDVDDEIGETNGPGDDDGNTTNDGPFSFDDDDDADSSTSAGGTRNTASGNDGDAFTNGTGSVDIN